MSLGPRAIPPGTTIGAAPLARESGSLRSTVAPSLIGEVAGTRRVRGTAFPRAVLKKS
jgi:hypothetical protein